MAYDEKLAGRIRKVFPKGGAEKEMFGGVAFMLGGNMCVGIVGDDLMARVGPEAHDACLAMPHARPMDFSGRPMKGYVYVAPAGLKTDAALGAWIGRASAFVKTLPPKKAKKKR